MSSKCQVQLAHWHMFQTIWILPWLHNLYIANRTVLHILLWRECMWLLHVGCVCIYYGLVTVHFVESTPWDCVEKVLSQQPNLKFLTQILVIMEHTYCSCCRTPLWSVCSWGIISMWNKFKQKKIEMYRLIDLNLLKPEFCALYWMTLRTEEIYCQLKEGALDRTVWRNRFGRGFGPVIWQITDDDDI